MQNHIIWKKSIYDKKFKCKCGAPLADPATGEPSMYLGLDGEQFNKKKDTDCYCVKCHELVATIKWNQNTNFEDRFPGNYTEMMEEEKKKVRSELLPKLKKEAEEYYQKEIETYKKIAKDYTDFAHKTKVEAENRIKAKEKQIRELTKELDAKDAIIKKMEKALNGQNTDK